MGNCWIFVKDDSKHKEINYHDIENIHQAKIVDEDLHNLELKNKRRENSASSKIVNPQSMEIIRKESHPIYS